ncbi:hypothetical protein CARUB_v10007600mg [Capsella rubella]|uniref:Neprosin PEP catalytic domain-containing protein n=1 Tax=Capsella rubella TaxID=81985 RepID=R0H2U1_9BRAS|nr:uncharacterized protein LOC17877876 [Capsella rubella]EOA18965.1 hypothetical protein CARUB_v10007600mg [Capsella rubella]
MGTRGPVIWLFLMCCIFGHIIVSHNNGFVEAKRFSKFEDLEIEKRLKDINKPAVKIIKTIDGESYGCVDFFKQPTFDHPSMKNPANLNKMRQFWEEMSNQTNDGEFGYLWENGVGCPIGTVPRQIVTKEDLLRLDSLDDNHKPRASWNTTSDDPNNQHYDQHHFAVAYTKNIGKRFHGAAMGLCITAPKVEPTQFSSSRLHMQIGSGYIQIGVTVNPVLYKDDQPRTYVYTNTNGASCYNNYCRVGMDGFRPDFPLGMALKPVSVRGADVTHLRTFRLAKWKSMAVWWFEFGKKLSPVGLWPDYWFNQTYGNYIEWGGEVYSANQPSPPMGYGYYPVGSNRWDAYMQHISVVDTYFDIDFNVNYLEDFNSKGYKVRESTDPIHHGGHVIFYGGPGNI